MSYPFAILLPIIVILLNMLMNRHDVWKFIGMSGCLILASTLIIHNNWFVLRNWIPMRRIGYKPIDFGFKRIINKESKLALFIYPYNKKNEILIVLKKLSSRDETTMRNFELEIDGWGNLVPKVIEFEKSDELDKAIGIPLMSRMSEMNSYLRDLIAKGGN